MATYRRKYLCICDGQQETMYLSHVAKLIKDFPRKVVTFNTFVDSPHRLEKRYEDYLRTGNPSDGVRWVERE